MLRGEEGYISNNTTINQEDEVAVVYLYLLVVIVIVIAFNKNKHYNCTVFPLAH